MPECVSLERRKVLEAFGAKLVLSPGNEGTDGAIRLAHKIYDGNRRGYFMPNQFDNPANVRAHFETTGREVYEQTGGEVSVFVAGMGTTGTLMGAGRRLKEYSSSITVLGVEPILGHKIQGLKNMTEAIVPKIFDPRALDEKWNVQDDDAFNMTRRLAVEEGIFAGMSSGAAQRSRPRASAKVPSAKNAPAQRVRFLLVDRIAIVALRSMVTGVTRKRRNGPGTRPAAPASQYALWVGSAAVFSARTLLALILRFAGERIAPLARCLVLRVAAVCGGVAPGFGDTQRVM